MNHPRRRPRLSAKLRAVTIQVDRLEDRQLLAAGVVARPTFELFHPMGGVSPFANPGYTPAQIEQAYGFNQISFGSAKADGTGQTIALVDAYSDPTIQNDLNTFDSAYGLPAATVTQYNESGATTSLPAADSTGGWELEESLDVEWAHAMAPGAKIDLFEASSASDADLLAAVSSASKVAGVVSMSWGGGEFSQETGSGYDGVFTTPKVAYVASSGDDGSPISWPAASPNVLAVGGTALTLGSGNSYSSESGWSGSGGGPSAYETQPTYQKGVVTQTTTQRANPDVSYDANPSTGFSVYDSDPYEVSEGQYETLDWLEVGGTSAGAPQWSALLAIADQGRALSSQPLLDSSSPQQVLTTLYANATTGDFHDVTTGTSTSTNSPKGPSYTAGVGYDYVTGLGSPVANLVVQSLDGTVTAAPTDHLVISESAKTPDVAGTSFTVTVTADTSANVTDTGYTGTIKLTSSDAQALGLTSGSTLTNGVGTFTVTLKTAGTQTITATDTSNSTITATTSAITVTPAAASQLVLSGLPAADPVGVSQSFTVTAKDPYGNVATGDNDTIKLTSTDAQAVFSASPKLTAGVGNYSVKFGTVGTQSVTAADGSIAATQSGIAVDPAAPTNLTATAASATQINLTWTASAGATGYAVWRSTGNTGSFAQVGTTAAGTTTYSNTGLAAGTTYYYEVRATAGSFNSAFSNVASAITTGTGSGTGGTTDTLWSNTYTPSENAYASGSYDVGVKFESSQAGTVTGIRFYKQTWMGGYTHVGDLWSSSGTLLATATFTGETSYGWQQVNLSSPVSIAANTVYIASFTTGGGYFGISEGFFNSTGVTNGPLTAPSSGAIGGNGVYGSGSTFPTYSEDGFNFWADVAFSPTGPNAVVGQAGAPSGKANSVAITPGTGGGSASASDTVPFDLTGQSTGTTANHPRSPIATSPFQGRQALLSGYWLARGNTSQLVTQADLSGRDHP